MPTNQIGMIVTAQLTSVTQETFVNVTSPGSGGDTTVDIDTFIRGRRGTSRITEVGHSAGALFILLNQDGSEAAIDREVFGVSQFGNTKFFRATTVGNVPDDATFETQVLNATDLHAHRNYLIVGGTSGTEPGTALPGGLATLPVNWDWFSDLEMSLLNTYTFLHFMGALDAQGSGTAQLNVPPLPSGVAGVKMHYAYCCNNPFDYVSNPVMVEIADY